MLKREVGVKFHAAVDATVAVPATVPSIEIVTISPIVPFPLMTGSAVVVSVLPLTGVTIIGGGGGGGGIVISTVKLSVAAVELGPPDAA